MTARWLCSIFGAANLAASIVIVGVSSTEAQTQDSKDIVDSKGEYTNRGIAIATIAGAQVAEMRCGDRGWIAAAIQKFDRMGLHVDVNDKEDYSNIVFFASEILKKVEKLGASKWCKDTAPQLAKIIEGH